jgi:glycosyltransferase involved in cell wall biosynthesis
VRTANVSVAVATLDRPEELAECLNELLRGDVLPAEVIVVDQGTDDRAQMVIAQRATASVPIVAVRQHQRGLSVSRNAAIERARQPLLAFTDDDCVPHSGWVGAVESAFTSPVAPDAVTGRVLALGPPIPGTFVVSPRESARRADFSGKQIPWLVGTGGNFALRREWFARVGRFDERLGVGSPGRAGEDADLFYRLLEQGARFRYEPSAIVYHRRQSRSRRLASRWGYGHGIGALCGLRLRQGDPYAVRILAFWLVTTLRELSGAMVRGEWLEARQRVLGLQGTARGLAYGVSVQSAPERSSD